MSECSDSPAPDETSPATDEPECPPPPRPPRAPWLTMGLNLALIATIFLTRERWRAWVVERRVSVPGSLSRMATSSDGKRAALLCYCGGYPQRVVLLDVPSGRTVVVPYWGRAMDVAISPDGALIALRDWDGIHEFLETCLFLRDPVGRFLVADMLTGQVCLMLKDAPNSFAWSPDSTLIAVAEGDGHVRLLDARSGKCRLTLERHGLGFSWVRFSPKGDRAATTGGGDHCRIWDPRSGQQVAEVQKMYRYRAPEPRFVAGGDVLLGMVSAQDCWIWDSGTGRVVGKASPVETYVISPDGSRMASVVRRERCVRIWDTRTGREVSRLTEPDGFPDPGGYLEVPGFFLPDGRRFLSFRHGLRGLVWDIEEGTALLELPGVMRDSVIALPSDRILGNDLHGILWFRDGTTGDLVHSLPTTRLVGSLGDERVLVEHRGVTILRRIRPEAWWGVAWLWHFWLIVALAAALVASAWRDIRRMRGRADAPA